MKRWSLCVCLAWLSLLGPGNERPAIAQLKAPAYEQCRLDAIFPAGGQAGQTVTVEFMGTNGGLEFPETVLIDGAGGMTVGEVKRIDPSRMEAKLIIAPDAAPGRRAVRVVSGQSGLTNLAWFTVGRLPEQIEQEPNNEPSTASPVTIPLTINGRVNPETDVDCYRFSARAGQKIVAAVQAHSFDAHGQSRKRGIIDAQLKVLDASGRVIADEQDTLGLDPVAAFVVPADGEYTACVQLLGFDGSPWAVYRLTLGEVPFPTHAFPAGAPRGHTVETRLFGWNLPDEGQPVTVSGGVDSHPLEMLTVGGPVDSGFDVPLMRSDLPEAVEAEPNNEAAQATAQVLPVTVNGRFETPGDADWYRLELTDTSPVRIETFAHRFLRAPVDTALQVLDANGQVLQETDDGVTDPGYESFHDFRSTDSRLIFQPKQPGTYFVRVTEANGSGGPRAIYRLVLQRDDPDFEIIQFPDAVPVWGPGTTAGLLVKLERRGNLTADVELSVEGLASGWTGSRFVNAGEATQRTSHYGGKQFLTITAPANAQPGSVTPFRIVGRAVVDGRTIERTAWPLTLYYTSDTGFFRISPVSRAAVTRPVGVTLAQEVAEVNVTQGESGSVPVRVTAAENLQEITLAANVATNGVACSLDAPATVPVKEGIAICPLKLPSSLPPGIYSLTIALSWRSDIRIGMPGPSTAVMSLKVLPKAP